jgi:hypothetical protein
MSKLVAWASVLGLLLMAAGNGWADDQAESPKIAADALLSRLDKIAHDAAMTSAKRAMLAAGEVQKFNQQYKGKPLSLRLKIQDVVPYAKGSYVSAGNPDLAFVQFRTAMFQINLPIAEAAAIGRDSVLLVSGTVSAATEPRPRGTSSVLEPGAAISFPSRANASYRIWLDNASWQVEHAKAAQSAGSEGNSADDKTAPADAATADDSLVMPTTPGHKHAGADKLKSEETRSMDDLKAFFLKGITASQLYGSKTTNNLGTMGSAAGSAAGSAYGAGSGRVKHNHVYVADELIHKFGEPATRSSAGTTETWLFKCKDGAVRVRFAQIFNVAGASASKLRLEVISVDSASGTGTGPIRFGR